MGDTVYWYKYVKELEEELELTDFEKSKNDFVFRFSNHGQIVEIIKENTLFSGTIINYIYYSKREKSKRKVLFNKIFLSAEKTEQIYNSVQRADVLNLPSDVEIKNWGRGRDGRTYIVEYSDTIKYSIKSYWEPFSQEEIPAAFKVSDFIDIISDRLQLEESYIKFRDSLPKRNGFYYNRNGFSITHYNNRSSYLGYSGATKLPLGVFASYFTSYLGNKELNLGGLVQYNFDTNGFYHFKFQASKTELFIKEKKLRDFVSYIYQNRKIDIKLINNQFKNHQFLYGMHLENFGLGAGLDYFKKKNISKTGVLLYTYKYFQKLNLSTTASSSIFNDQINYKIDLERNFNLGNRSSIGNISVGLGYEDFMNYKDIYFKILTHF
ncbi:MAG: hypothetical protein RSF68_11130 [Myroides sp.]